ncbi:MAG: TonB-dependent receptor, partial [Gammaproteobacteria bacterium]|nr:TonB-dependent receptor [Gammaproteobacteria bacterium]
DTSGIANQPHPDIGVNGGIVLGGVVPGDPREVTHNVDQNQHNSSDLYNAKVIWNTGDVELQSITAYQNTSQNHAIDLDATNVDFSSSFPESDVDTYSQEFRLSSPRGKALSWVAGLFLSKDDASQQADIHFPLAAVQNLSVSTTNNSNSAVFGELNYLLAPRWQGRIGVRYNYDEAKIDQQQTINDPLGVMGSADVTSVSFQDKQTWHALTPEFGLTFNADKDTFYYGKISRGYKGGGYNTYSIQPSYDPEFMWAYEAGIKTDVPGQPVRINTSLFYYDYSDMQLLTLPSNAPVGTLPIITNAARSVIKGIDLQIWYQPVADLELTVGATILDAYFKEFVSVDPNNPADDPDRSGDPLPMAPDVSLVLGASYQWSYFREGDLKLAASYKYQSAVYFNPYQ